MVSGGPGHLKDIKPEDRSLLLLQITHFVMSLTKPSSSPALDEREQEWTRVLVEKIRALRFGSVHIKIHEAQVVLIETTEQTRFELSAKPRQ